MDKKRIFAAINVENGDEFLDKIYSGNLSELEQDILVEELTDQDIFIRDFINELANEKLKTNHQFN